MAEGPLFAVVDVWLVGVRVDAVVDGMLPPQALRLRTSVTAHPNTAVKRPHGVGGRQRVDPAEEGRVIDSTLCQGPVSNISV